MNVAFIFLNFIILQALPSYADLNSVSISLAHGGVLEVINISL